MTIKKSDFLLNFMMFCLGPSVGRRIGDPYIMRHLAAKSADLMLVNLPHWMGDQVTSTKGALSRCILRPWNASEMIPS
jgi:hypothetical protein